MQKSGTHALMAHLEARGLRRHPGMVKSKGGKIVFRNPASAPVDGFDFVHGHVPTKARKVAAAAGLEVVTILRDPRNVLVSYARAFSHRLGGAPDLAAAMDDFFGRRFVNVAMEYADWQDHCEIVRYEDIRPPVSKTRMSQTWTGAPSDWRACWTPEIDRKWTGCGGREIVARFGY